MAITFLCVCLLIDDKCRHNIVKVVCVLGYRLVDPHYLDNVIKRTDASKSDVNLLI